MVTVLDEEVKNPSFQLVRTLMYENASELTGNAVVTGNAGTVHLLPGSVAFKAGFTDMMQLDPSGVWRSC